MTTKTKANLSKAAVVADDSDPILSYTPVVGDMNTVGITIYSDGTTQVLLYNLPGTIGPFPITVTPTTTLAALAALIEMAGA